MKSKFYALVVWTSTLYANTAYGENFRCPEPGTLRTTIPDGWAINLNDINKSRTNLNFTEAILFNQTQGQPAVCNYENDKKENIRLERSNVYFSQQPGISYRLDGYVTENNDLKAHCKGKPQNCTFVEVIRKPPEQLAQPAPSAPVTPPSGVPHREEVPLPPIAVPSPPVIVPAPNKKAVAEAAQKAATEAAAQKSVIESAKAAAEATQKAVVEAGRAAAEMAQKAAAEAAKVASEVAQKSSQETAAKKAAQEATQKAAAEAAHKAAAEAAQKAAAEAAAQKAAEEAAQKAAAEAAQKAVPPPPTPAPAPQPAQ
jgi:primosomal protein N'